MIGNWFRKRSLAARGKLIVLAFNLPNQSSHFFNELLGYESAAEELGLTARIFVPRDADPLLVRKLSAAPVLGPLARFSPVKSHDIARKQEVFLKASKKLEYVWKLIEAEDLSSIRAIVCTQPNPALIRAAGLWVRHQKRAPATFFRFTSTFALAAATSPVTDLIRFSRIACTELKALPGQERLYFLVNGAKMARSVMRECNRRAFVVPMPKHYGDVQVASSLQPAQPIVYIHLNSRSGPLIQRVGEIIRNTRATHPDVRFVLKFTKSVEVGDSSTLFDGDIASIVEILPSEQTREEYLANMRRCSVVVLAYQPDVYVTGTSGVFAEAVGFGKPVVVPAGTWMAQEVSEGRGAGTLFAEATPKAIATAVCETLEHFEKLLPVAQQIAPIVRMEHSSKHVLESMLALAQESFDMEPRYSLDEDSDVDDFR